MIPVQRAGSPCRFGFHRCVIHSGPGAGMTNNHDFSEDGSAAGPSVPSTTGWVTHKGPANWFRFRCPRGYRVRQNETFIEIVWNRAKSSGSGRPAIASESEAAEGTIELPPSTKVRNDDSATSAASPALVIFATWVGDSARPLEFGDVISLFPQIVHSNPEAPLDLATLNVSWSGLSRLPVNGPWWRRWLTRRPLFQWRCWSMAHSAIQILATIQSVPGQPLDADFVACCEQILNSLELTDAPAWPPEMFRRQVVKLAADHFPLLTVSASGAFGLRIADSEINLANFYRSYLQQPGQFKRIVLPGITTVVRLQELGPGQLMPGLEEARNRILPMLSPDSELLTEDTIRVPWVGGLCVSFVLDEDESYRFVHRRMLEDWNLTTDDLHELAIRNLRSYAVENPLEVTMIGEEDDPRLLMPVRPNAYNCARLLDPGFHGRLRELFGPELIVGIPNRDFFVAVSFKHPALIEQVQRRVAEDHSNMHHPLTRRLLVISADGVSEYCRESV